jgi:hypothetical protein
LGAFAGLRPEAEAMKLQWQDIDWQSFEICITKSKNEISHRIIGFKDFAAPLLAWLSPYVKEAGKIYPYQSTTPYIHRLERARYFAAQRLEASGLEAPRLRDWPQDVVRHTFATFHSTHFGDVNRTADTLGHGFSTKMLRTHYRGLVSPSETPIYWSLHPTKQLPAPGEDPYQGVMSPCEGERRAQTQLRRATDPQYRARAAVWERNRKVRRATDPEYRERVNARRRETAVLKKRTAVVPSAVLLELPDAL